MFKIAICDDSLDVRSELENTIIEIGLKLSERFETEVYSSGENLIKDMKNGLDFDFIFLDIELGTCSGVDIGDNIRSKLKENIVHIVYISSFKSYAMNLFKVRPLDFLIKPLKKIDIIEVINKGILLSNKMQSKFEYKIGRDYFKEPIKNIQYFKSIDREVEMVTNNDRVRFYQSLATIKETLQNLAFFCPHKSYLVNYNNVKDFSYSDLIMNDGMIIPISQNRRKEVRSLQLLMEKENLNVPS